MRSRTEPRTRLDAATIRACGDLLRRLGSTNGFHSNVLVAQLPAGQSSKRMGEIVGSVLNDLPPLVREIVTRCDIGGEQYAAVAKALFVSERHLFRLRRDALARIADALLRDELPSTTHAVEVLPDALDARLRMSEALADRGAWREAGELLKDLVTEVPAERRGALEVQLSRLYVDADRFDLARHHAEEARGLASRCSEDQQWQRAEADVSLAVVAAGSGDWIAADAILQRSVTELRSWIAQSNGTRVRHALVTGLLVQAEIADNRGDDAEIDLATQACSLVKGSDPVDGRVALEARTMVAVTSLIRGKNSQRAEASLWDCYYSAVAAGMLRDSLIIATNLAGHYRGKGQPAEAVRFLRPLLGTARVAGSGWVHCGVLSHFVKASLEMGALERAAAYLEKMSDVAGDNVISQADVALTRARVQFALANFEPARRAATAAETAYAEMDMSRPVSTALRTKAEALAALGRSAEALRAITQAIEIISESGHPLKLAGAYRSMARISQRPQYAVAAERLVREARETL